MTSSFCLLRQDRLLGLLMPFRAFGDVKFKWSIELQKRVLESGPDQLHENEHTKFIPPNYHTPPYLTAEPEITYHKLRPQDRFMVRGAVSSLTCSLCVCYQDTAEQADQHSDNQTELLFNQPQTCYMLSRLLIINGSFRECCSGQILTDSYPLHPSL